MKSIDAALDNLTCHVKLERIEKVSAFVLRILELCEQEQLTFLEMRGVIRALEIIHRDTRENYLDEAMFITSRKCS